MNKLVVYLNVSFFNKPHHFPVFLDTNNTSEHMWENTNNLSIQRKLVQYLQENELPELLGYASILGNVNIAVDLDKIVNNRCNILVKQDSQGLCNVKVIYNDELTHSIQQIQAGYQELFEFLEEGQNQRLTAEVDVVEEALLHQAIRYTIVGKYMNSTTGKLEHVEQTSITANVPIL
jgi:hypothetical protein